VASLKNKNSEGRGEVLKMNASLRMFYPVLSVFYSWGSDPEAPWRISLGLGYRWKNILSVSTGGPLHDLMTLDPQYREAYQDGVEIAERELSREITKLQSLSRWIPSLTLTKVF
jgi:hypothetical protein